MKKQIFNKYIDRIREAQQIYSQFPDAITLDSEVTDSEFRVFTGLLIFADKDMKYSWRGNKKIAEYLNRSENTIKRGISGLRKKGWITTIRRGVMRANITILHAYKNEKISEADKKRYLKQVEKDIEEWKWREYRKRYGYMIEGGKKE